MAHMGVRDLIPQMETVHTGDYDIALKQSTMMYPGKSFVHSDNLKPKSGSPRRSSTVNTPSSPVKRSSSRISTNDAHPDTDDEASESPTRQVRADTLHTAAHRPEFVTPRRLPARRRNSEPKLQLTVAQFFSPTLITAVGDNHNLSSWIEGESDRNASQGASPA